MKELTLVLKAKLLLTILIKLYKIQTDVYLPGFEFSKGGALAPTFTVGPPDVELDKPEGPTGPQVKEVSNL